MPSINLTTKTRKHVLTLGAMLSAMERLGISSHQAKILIQVCGPDYRTGVQMSELAPACGVSTAAITGLTDTMESRDLVKREPSKTDRRKIMVRVTSLGARCFRQMLKETENLLDEDLVNEKRGEVA